MQQMFLLASQTSNLNLMANKARENDNVSNLYHAHLLNREGLRQNLW